MDLKRKALNQLILWKGRKNHKPIIIEGLRQVGKSYVAEKFSKENYENFIVFDFRHDISLNSIFRSDKDNAKMTVESIIQNASIHFPEKKFIKGKTCLVFDEIGDSPLARESFKVFGVNSGFDIVATGSLLGLAGVNQEVSKNTPVGYEEYLKMTALDFEEFLWANGVNDFAIDKIKECVSSWKELPENYHGVLSSYLIRYMLVGGMPEAVTSFLETANFMDSRAVQTRLLKDYEDDFGKKNDKNGRTIIDSNLLIKTSRAYHSIPDQLAKENKKFKFSLIQHGGRSSEFSDALEWLSKAGIIAFSHNLRSIEMPLAGNSITEEFKVYPTDIGLLMASYPLATTQEIIKGNLSAYKGALYEGLAAEMLYKAGFDLFYYSDTKRHLENDFLIETAEGILVIESKATNGKMASAKALAQGKTPYKIDKVYKMVSGNFGKGTFFDSIPQYAFPFLLEQINSKLSENLVASPLPKLN